MSNLANYNQSALDKTFPDHEETVFGHMVIEMGMPPAIAAQKLRPWVKNFTRSSESAKKLGYGMGFGGVLVGILIGATAGIGLAALAPALAGAWCINDGLTSTKEHSAREAEYLMLMECPELVKLIFALSQRGLSADVLVEAYDDLVRSYGDSVQEGSDIDKYAIVSHFQMLISEKSQLAGVTAAMVDELNVKVFDDLYDRESDAPLAGQGSKSQSRHGETIEPEFDDFSAGLNALPFSGKRPTVEEAIAALSLPGLTVEEFIGSTKPDRDVESAVKQAQSVTTPTKADVLKMPLSDRADYLLKLLAEYGCDLRSLIGRPTLAAGGLQRSGKTTLIMLLGIIEKAKGQKLYYISRDSDLYPVAFDGYANGSIKNAVAALGVLSQTINSGSMGSLSGQTWVLDEFSSTAKELDEKTRSDFWGMALTGFAKQGGRVRFIVHHKTAKANGIPGGEAETFKAEVKMFWTDRTEMSDGTYQPSGQYELLQEVGGFYKESGQTFQIPEWLLTEKNPAWHNAPCPVRSLLEFFPEFDTREGAIAHPLNESKPKNPFDKSVQVVKPNQSSDDPWHEYEIHTNQMSLESLPPNPKVDKLISDLQNNSKDPRSPDFIDWLKTLRTGQAIDEAGIDPQFVGIARHRKIISKEGVVS